MRKRMSVGACAQRTFSLRIHRATDGMRTMRSIVRMPALYEPGHTQCASKGEALCENEKGYPCALAQKDSLSRFHIPEKEGFEPHSPSEKPVERRTSAPLIVKCNRNVTENSGHHMMVAGSPS